MKNFLQVNRALRAKKNFNFNFKHLLVLSAVLLLGSTQVWGTDYTWDFTTNTFLNGGTWSTSAGTTNTAYATDGITTLTYVAGGGGDKFENSQLKTQGTTSFSTGTSKKQLNQKYFKFPTLNGTYTISVTYGDNSADLKIYEATSTNIYGLEPIITLTSSSTTSSSYSFSSSKTYYMTMESAKAYFKKIEIADASVTRYKVTYKANGGTGDDVVREYLSGTTVYVAPNYMFSNSGYIFTGWNTKADGSGTHFDFYTNDASYYHQSLTLTKDTVLFAKWKAEETTNSDTRYCISIWNSSNNGKPYFTQKIGDKDEYMMNYTVPDKDASNNWPKYWVGKNENFYKDNLGSNNNSKSVEDELADISIKSQRNRKLGLAAGALGTLHINDRSGDDNLYICFLPKRYGIVTGSGALASSASGISFYTTEYDNEWITDVVQMTSTLKSGNYYVGFMKSDGTFVKSEATDRNCISVQATMSSMGIYVRGTGWSVNQVGTEIADDSYGAFRLWSNTDQNNFQCHWVPYYGLKYNANGGTGAPALTGVAQEGSNAQRTIKVSTTEPTRDGYSFEGWATSSANATAGTKAYDPGDDIKLSADVELFAIWSCVDPTITTDLSEDEVDYNVGDAATALTVAATAAGGSVSYQWYSNDEANTTTPTTLTTGASYTPSTAAAGTTYYYCVITNSTAGCSTTATSSFAKIVVSRKDPTKYDFTATSASICSGDDATFTLAGSQVGATYYITKNNAGSDAIDTKVGTGSALTFTATSATTGDYYCHTTETTAFNAIKVSKNKATISYKTATSVTVDDATLDDAVVDEEYTISGITGAGAGTLYYQWYSYLDDEGNDETEIDGAEDDTYAFTPDAEGDYYFKCEVTGDCGSVKSDLITVTATVPCSAPTSPGITGTTSYTAGETISLTASATGTSGSTTYQWYKGDPENGGVSQGDASTSGATFSKSAVVADEGTYYCVISNGEGCTVTPYQAITVSCATAPSAVSSLTCSAKTTTSLTYTWNKASNASGYTATLYSDSDCKTQVSTSSLGDVNTVTFSTLSVGTTYYCKVQSKGNGTVYCVDGGTTSAVSGTTLYQYAISYNAGTNGTGSISGGTKTEGTAFTLSSSKFTRDGYIQIGWALTDGGTKAYELGGSYTTDAAQTFYPVWGILYTVTFNSNGGSAVASKSQTTYEGSISMPDAPTYADHTFQGWVIGGTTKAVGASYTPTANVTAYASWEATCTGGGEDFYFSKYVSSPLSANTDKTKLVSTTTKNTITLECQSNTNTSTRSTDTGTGIVDGTSINFSSSPTYIKMSSGDTIAFTTTTTSTIKVQFVTASNDNSGIELRSTSKTGTLIESVLVSSKQYKFQVLTASANPAGKYVIVAKNKEIDLGEILVSYTGGTCYYVTYDGNGAEAGLTSDPTAYAKNDDPEVLDNGDGGSAYTKSGNTFTGWYTKAVNDGTGTAYAPGATITDINDNITLYAQWREACSSTPTAPSSLTNGATTTNTQVVTWTANDEDTWEVYHGTSSSTPGTDQTPTATVTSATYTFTGLTASTQYYWWARSKCDASHKSSWVAGTSFTTSAATYTLTATAKTNMKGTFSGSKTITNSPVSSVASGTTIATSDNTFTVGGSTTVAAPETIAGTVEVDDGGKPYNASCTWRFSKWNNIVTPVAGDESNIEAEYAPSFDINYTLGGGTINEDYPTYYIFTDNEEDEISLPTNVTKANYTFDHWVDAWSNTRSKITCDYWGDFNLTAVWTAKTSPGSGTVSGTTSICSGDNTDITLSASVSGASYQLYKGEDKVGDAKAGTGSALTWSVSEIGTYTVKAVETATHASGDMSGSAVISASTATSISTQPETSVSGHDGVDFTLGSDLSATGEGTLTYQWYSYTSAEGAGQATVGSATTTKTLTTSKAAGTYYYKVEVIGTCGEEKSDMITVTVDNKHRITYDANNGSGAPSGNWKSPGSMTLPADLPTRSGYIFLGWNTKNDGTGDMYQPSGSFTMPSSATTLYAAWASPCFTFSKGTKGTEPEDGFVMTPSNINSSAFTAGATLSGGNMTNTSGGILNINGSYGFVMKKNEKEITLTLTGGQFQEGTVIELEGKTNSNSTVYTYGFSVSGNAATPLVTATASSNDDIKQRYVVTADDGVEGTSSCTIEMNSSASGSQTYLSSIKIGGCMSCTPITPTLTYSSSTIYADGGTPRQARPTITGNTGSGDVTYSSSNTDAVTVNSSTGVATAVAPGSATITARIASSGDYCGAVATTTLTIPSLVQQTINLNSAWSTVPNMTFPGDPTETLTKNANIAATGYSIDESSNKSGLSSKIYGIPSTTSKDDNYYMSLKFNTPSYPVRVTSVVVPIQPITNTASAIVTVSDGTTTVTSNEEADIPDGAKKTCTFTITPTVFAAGSTITVKIFVYDQSGDKGFRLGSPILVNGSVLKDQKFTGSGSWSNPANWDGGSVPESYHDVVISSGKTSTITSDVTVNNITIETGATLNVSVDGEENGVTFTANSLSLKGGLNSSGTKYDMPRVYIDPASSIVRTNSTINFDISVDQRHYYPIAVPFPVTVSEVNYVNSTMATHSIYGKHYVIKEYDGAGRAENGAVDENWKVVSNTAGTKLQPGKGYILTAISKPAYGGGVIRFPMNVDDAWLTEGEQTTVSDVTKNEVDVKAYTGKATEGDKNANKGWNMLGVPYMSCFASKGNYAHDAEGGFIKGKLNFITGEYTETSNVYVTVPTSDFSEYLQFNFDDADTKLLPGWCFFVQVDKDGTITFEDDGQTNSSSLPIYAPKREQEMPTVKTGIILSSETASDKTTILVSDKYSVTDYEINADLEKMFGNGYTLATYSLAGETRLAYNAMSRADAANVIPIGYRAPAEGEYTFAINPRYAESGDFERIDLIDYETGFVTNLLQSSYTFTSDRTQSDSRFALNVVPQKETPTDVEPVTGDGLPVTGARKVIIDNKLYIILNGKMYDAKGVMVK